MSNSDWKAPFLRFRDQVRPLFDAGVKIHHGILMSPFYEKHEINGVVENLAAADVGQPLALTVETPTEDCKYLAQFFYGESASCNLFNQALNGIEHWILGAPKGLLPTFDLRYSRNATCPELATWASLVYWIAWEIDAPYLQATVEYTSRVHVLTAEPWSEAPWPQNCDPRPVLIRQSSKNGMVANFLRTFEDGLWCPDIIGAHLQGDPFVCDFIGASLAAVDILVFQLDQRPGRESVQGELSSAIKKRSTKRRGVSSDTRLLKAFLRVHHDPRETGDKAFIPLTTEQIAEGMEWFNESGKPLQSKASRQMTEIFGPRAMDKYKSLFQGDIKQGFRKVLGDGSRDLDGIVEPDN